MIICCIYRPPRGNVAECIKILTEICTRKENSKREIWFFGDFNLDYLDRTNSNVSKFNVFFKKFGMVQLIKNPTRPGKYKSTCIDWIVTNSRFVSDSIVSDIMISDHFAICCVRKKDRERISYVYRTLRNYTKYNREDMIRLMKQSLDRSNYLSIRDPNELWTLILKSINDILEIMCPLRNYKQREVPTPWMTPEIYTAIRLRDKLVRQFKYSRSNYFLTRMRQQRNHVNGLIESAKKAYICDVLRQNTNNPRKFWKLINQLLDGSNNKFENNEFIDPSTDQKIKAGCESDFLNEYFCNISERLGLYADNVIDPNVYIDLENMYGHIDQIFNLVRTPSQQKSWKLM